MANLAILIVLWTFAAPVTETNSTHPSRVGEIVTGGLNVPVDGADRERVGSRDATRPMCRASIANDRSHHLTTHQLCDGVTFVRVAAETAQLPPCLRSQSSDLTQVCDVFMNRITVDEAILSKVAQLENVWKLHMEECQIAAGCGAKLATLLPGLVFIGISNPTSNEQVDDLLQQSCELRGVWITSDEVKDLDPLSELPKLTVLYVNNGALRFPRRQEALKALRILALHNVALESDDVAAIGSISLLEDLTISGASITDQDLRLWKRLSGLGTLRLYNTDVTLDGIAELKTHRQPLDAVLVQSLPMR